MKSYWRPLLTGLVIALLMVLVMWQITMDFQVLLFLGTGLFFAGGLINADRGKYLLLTAASILVFYGAFFVLLVLEELPALWYFVPVYAASAVLGLVFPGHKTRAGLGAAGLLAVLLLLAFYRIPADLENMLARERYDALPEFSLQDIDGNRIESRDLAGKVVVLDFFGTWCKPCILELRELAQVKAALAGGDVVFLVVDADQGGDTPEKFRAFIEKNDYTFRFAYDRGSALFKKLKMAHLGLPTLLIVDREQQIRYQHVGYNPAETGFAENLIGVIRGLQ